MQRIIKSIFILGIILLFITIYQEDKEISNRVYNASNVTINYPYFNNKKIDKYIENFIINNMNYSNTFIDYDYNLVNNNYYVKFYIYKFNNNIYKYDERCFYIDITDSIVTEVNGILDDYNYLNNNTYDNYKLIALTFDDGPSSFTEEIIDLLQKYDYNATFFVLGNKLNLNYKDILKKSIKNGNEIGVHGYSHRSFTKMRQATMEEEITKTKKYIKNLTGYESTLVRPPYGNITKTIKNYNLGPYILWNNDTLDWKLRDANKISSRLINSIEDKSIILMHDTYLTTFKALEIILPYLKENNYVVTTVSKIYELNGITLENNKSYRYIK